MKLTTEDAKRSVTLLAKGTGTMVDVEFLNIALDEREQMIEEVNRIIRICESKIEDNNDEREITRNAFDRGLLLGQNMTLGNMCINLKSLLKEETKCK
jgi:hypothetical protein